MTDFRDNVVIITGASAGIGLEVARQLSAQGAKLVLAAREPDLLEVAAQACRALGGQVIAVQTDVSDSEQCRRLIEAAAEAFGRIDTLVNNAGISMHARFDQLSDVHAVDRITSINYFGSVYCTWYALPYLKRSRGKNRRRVQYHRENRRADANSLLRNEARDGRLFRFTAHRAGR
jgi:Short-chain alcohol dehydrogenase of unknown specificity